MVADRFSPSYCAQQTHGFDRKLDILRGHGPQAELTLVK